MNLYIYVGPYLAVTNFEWEMLDDIDEWLTDGRGEAGEDDGITYLVPNCDVDGISRRTEFEEHDDTPVVPIDGDAIQAECARFIDFCRKPLAFFDRNAVGYEVKWGVVPKWN